MESPVAESVLYPVTQYGMPIRTMLIYRNPFLENCWGVRFFPPSTHFKKADNVMAGHRVRLKARRWTFEV